MATQTVNPYPPETPAQKAAREAADAARIAANEKASTTLYLRTYIGDAWFILNSFTNHGNGTINYTLL